MKGQMRVLTQIVRIVWTMVSGPQTWLPSPTRKGIKVWHYYVNYEGSGHCSVCCPQCILTGSGVWAVSDAEVSNRHADLVWCG